MNTQNFLTDTACVPDMEMFKNLIETPAFAGVFLIFLSSESFYKPC